MNQKYLMAAAIGLGLWWMWSQQKKDTCEQYYLVGTDRVCETDLNAQGYYYWPAAPNGAGYYSAFNDFTPMYGIDPATFAQSVIEGLIDSMNASDPNYQTAQAVLNMSVKPNATPLVKASV